MSFYRWPKLPQVPGWAQDRDFAFRYSANTLSPIGVSFADDETVMCAKLVFEPRVPDGKSLAALIENDKNNFVTNFSGVTIQEMTTLATADGKKLISLIHTPADKGNCERVYYVEEGVFYLVFTVSYRTQAGFLASVKACETFVTPYKEKP